MRLEDVIIRPWEPGEEPPQQSLFIKGRQRGQPRRKLLGAGEGPRPCPSCGETRNPGEVKCPHCGNLLLTFISR